MSTTVRIALAGIATLALWLVGQMLINAMFMLAAYIRGDSWAPFLVKNFLSPAMAAYFSLEIVTDRFDKPPIRAICVVFAVFLALLNVGLTAFNSEHFLLAGRVADWREALWAAVLGTSSSIVATLAFARRKLRSTTQQA